MGDETGVKRFIYPQKKFYRTVKDELKSGKKQTHWMWFMFPQIRGLGYSLMSRYYGINGLAEAKSYMSVPLLKRNLVKLTNIVLKSETDIEDMFGPVDARKFHSCMTLFSQATGMRIFRKAIDDIFNGSLDEGTMVLLSKKG